MRSAVRRRSLVAGLAALSLAWTSTALSLGSAEAGPRETPPPTPVGSPPSPSPFVTDLDLPPDPRVSPSLDGGSAILADLDSGQVLFALDPRERRPIASVTKLMTALLVLRRSDPSEEVVVSEAAAAPDGSPGLSELGLLPGERVSVGDLTYALLLQSANDAAVALAEHLSGSVPRFVKLMNAEAGRLGMRDTEFRSPNGLDDGGFSTAKDLVKLARAAFSEPGFAKVVASRFADVRSSTGIIRHVQNRNVLLWLYRGAIGGKTGYTREAGFCLVAAAERDGRRLVAVILGSPTEPFSSAAALLNHGFAAFTEHVFVAAGSSLGLLAIKGGTVEVVAGEELSALVPVDSVAHAEITLSADPAAAFPPAPGERVGVVRVSIPGRLLGDVPVVVAEVPSPAAADDRPWWRRAAGSVAQAISGAVDALFG